MADEAVKSFSPLCLTREKSTTRRELASSLDAGWTSLLVQHLEGQSRAEEFESLPIPDFSLVLIASGARAIESFSGGKWKKAFLQPGDAGMTASGRTDRLRLGAPVSKPPQTIHIYIPAYYFAAAAEEYRRAGTSSGLEQPDALAFTDQTIAQIGYSLLDAAKTGAPNLYAESAAQFLAAHLLAKDSRWRAGVAAPRKAGGLSDSRLKRVLEYMRHHFAEDLTLDRLASEAGISRFHFIVLFKRAVGTTPHRYLVRLRLARAAELLRETDFSVQMIAATCGFVKPSHFSETFQKHFGQTAFEYRRGSRAATDLNKFR